MAKLHSIAWLYATMMSLAASMPSIERRQGTRFNHPIAIGGSTFTGGTQSTFEAATGGIIDNTSVSQVEGFQPATQVKARDIQGPDDREVWDHLEFPYSAMGRLHRSDGLFCTASLIGPRHITLARHCLLPYQGKAATFKFEPSYFDGERGPSANVVNTIHVPTSREADTPADTACDIVDDCKYTRAIAILDARLGDTLGYLGGKRLAAAQSNQPIFSGVGYPFDLAKAERMYHQDGIKIKDPTMCDLSGPVNTDADVFQGHSGGPLYVIEGDGTYVYAMDSASGEGGFSIYAGLQPWLSALEFARVKYT